MSVDSVQCPQCGAPLKAEPGRQEMYCSFCGSRLKLARGSSGHMMAVLDGNDMIVEASEDNNLAEKEIFIAEEEGIFMTTFLGLFILLPDPPL